MCLSTIIIYLFDCIREKNHNKACLCVRITCKTCSTVIMIRTKTKARNQIILSSKSCLKMSKTAFCIKSRNVLFCFVFFIFWYGTHDFHRIPACLMSIKSDLYEISCEWWMFLYTLVFQRHKKSNALSYVQTNISHTSTQNFSGRHRGKILFQVQALFFRQYHLSSIKILWRPKYCFFFIFLF